MMYLVEIAGGQSFGEGQGRKRMFGGHARAGQLRRGPKIDPHSVARKINISALDISPDQLYAQLVSNICSVLSLCQ